MKLKAEAQDFDALVRQGLMALGEKLKGILGKIKIPSIPLPPFLAKLANPIWNPPNNRDLARSLVVLVLTTIGVMGYSTRQFLKLVKAHRVPVVAMHHESESHEEEHVEEAHDEHGGGGHGGGGHGGGHGEESHTLGEAEFPRAVIEARRGKELDNKDLVDQEPSFLEGLKSGHKKDLQVHLNHYFVRLDQVFANAKDGNRASGSVDAKITLEVDSANGVAEIEKKKSQITSLVAAQLGERQRRELASVEGMVSLKMAIQEDINHIMTEGKVIDVLLSDFSVR